MKEKVKNVYYCDHCKKHGLSKSAMVMHEVRCNKNPNNKRACFGCQFLEKVEQVMYIDTPMGGEIERKINVLKCKVQNMYVYPPIVEHKGNMFDWGETNEPMPKECDLRKEIEF